MKCFTLDAVNVCFGGIPVCYLLFKELYEVYLRVFTKPFERTVYFFECWILNVGLISISIMIFCWNFAKGCDENKDWTKFHSILL